MLQGLAKAKALKELQALTKDKASLNGLALAKSLKRQNELRLDLGMGKSTPAQLNQQTSNNNFTYQLGETVKLKDNDKDNYIIVGRKKWDFTEVNMDNRHLPFEHRYVLLSISKRATIYSTVSYDGRTSKEINIGVIKFDREKGQEVDSNIIAIDKKQALNAYNISMIKTAWQHQKIIDILNEQISKFKNLNYEMMSFADLQAYIEQQNNQTHTNIEYADTLLFNKSGQILLAQRSVQDDFKPNKWWIVGGKIEQGETPEQGAIRELFEETGVKLFDLKFLEKVNLPTGGISHRFAEVVKDDTPIHLKKDELQEYHWVNIDELSKFDLLGKLSDLKNLVELASEIVGFDGWDGNDKTADIPQTAYQLADKATPTRRQKDNDTAIALLRELQTDGRKATADEKAILSRYTGTGGNLVGDDGLKGSDYEYYTPIEVAGSMWDLAKELGFDGGAVLDPSAGTGVFTATSPDNVLMDNIELDETSGRINQILNDGVRAKTTISPFEKVVNGYDDGDDETGFDLVMSNVPFGNNAARGANKMYDKAYQDASLDYYFILRSLEKLKSGGLAVLMTAPSTVQGKRAQEESRGQVAITAEDIALIPDIIKNYDKVEYSGRNRAGREVITYTKQYNDVVYYAEEVRDGKKDKRLTTQTMYKRKGSLPRTPETQPTIESQKLGAVPLDNTIPNTQTNVNV